MLLLLLLLLFVFLFCFLLCCVVVVVVVVVCCLLCLSCQKFPQKLREPTLHTTGRRRERSGQRVGERSTQTALPRPKQGRSCAISAEKHRLLRLEVLMLTVVFDSDLSPWKEKQFSFFLLFCSVVLVFAGPSALSIHFAPR